MQNCGWSEGHGSYEPNVEALCQTDHLTSSTPHQVFCTPTGLALKAMNFLDARGIAYKTNSSSGKALSAPDVIETAKTFSVEVNCQK